MCFVDHEIAFDGDPWNVVGGAIRWKDISEGLVRAVLSWYKVRAVLSWYKVRAVLSLYKVRAVLSWYKVRAVLSWYKVRAVLSWYKVRAVLSWYKVRAVLSWYKVRAVLSWYKVRAVLSWYKVRAVLSWYKGVKTKVKFGTQLSEEFVFTLEYIRDHIYHHCCLPLYSMLLQNRNDGMLQEILCADDVILRA